MLIFVKLNNNCCDKEAILFDLDGLESIGIWKFNKNWPHSNDKF